MTHIIGKPKPRKRGTTFGDVPTGKACRIDGKDYERVPESDECWNARMLGTEHVYGFTDDKPVTLLVPEPDPEPDPDVCTYVELEPGVAFVFLGDYPYGSGLCWSGVSGYWSDGEIWDEEESFCPLLVRRVPASVVVHEEPGTLALLDEDDPTRMRLEAPNGAFLGTLRIENVRAMVPQIAALLAADEREGQREPECVWSGDRRVTGCTSSLCPVHGPKPTEDRSKPAPGYFVKLTGDAYYVRHNGAHRASFWHKAGAIAWTWAQHDAQQAGEDGAE